MASIYLDNSKTYPLFRYRTGHVFTALRIVYKSNGERAKIYLLYILSRRKLEALYFISIAAAAAARERVKEYIFQTSFFALPFNYCTQIDSK